MALGAEEVRPGAGRLGVQAAIEQLPRVADGAVVVVGGAAENQVHGFLDFAADGGPSDAPGVAAIAETLRAKVVGDAAAPELRERVLQLGQARGLALADLDKEAIAAEVPQAQLVGVPCGLEDPHARQVQSVELVGVNVLDGHPLARDGPGVLQAGKADVVPADVERVGDVPHRLVRAQPGFFEQEIRVGARAVGGIERNLLDEEVRVVRLDHAGDGHEIGQ